MLKYLTIALMLLSLNIACSQQETVPVAEFGDTVRTVVNSQIHDYEAAMHPDPDAVEGADPYRMNNVLEAYRGDIAQPQEVQQPLTISVEN